MKLCSELLTALHTCGFLSSFLIKPVACELFLQTRKFLHTLSTGLNGNKNDFIYFLERWKEFLIFEIIRKIQSTVFKPQGIELADGFLSRLMSVL